jgi:hypothetical protein
MIWLYFRLFTKPSTICSVRTEEMSATSIQGVARSSYFYKRTILADYDESEL